jgi:hydrogenase maturation protease
MSTKSRAVNQGSGAHQTPEPSRILVLGIGNILLMDEGVGVRVIEALRNSFDFSDNVLLMDGGTLGLSLLDSIMEADSLVVIDAVCAGTPPGTLHRLTDCDLDSFLGRSNSLHDLGLAETLVAARMLDKRLDVVILGVEPESISNWSTNLSETVARRIPDLVTSVRSEVERMGGRCVPKDTGATTALSPRNRSGQHGTSSF